MAGLQESGGPYWLETVLSRGSSRELAELFKQGHAAEMNFGSSDEQGERGKKRPGIAGKMLPSERGCDPSPRTEN